jgi:hypothetical protein
LENLEKNKINADLNFGNKTTVFHTAVSYIFVKKNIHLNNINTSDGHDIVFDINTVIIIVGNNLPGQTYCSETNNELFSRRTIALFCDVKSKRERV